MGNPAATPTATSESTPALQAAGATMELLVVLTVNRGAGAGIEHYTHAQVATVTQRATRMDVLQWAVSQLPERFRDGSNPVVTFFSAGPNQLTRTAG